MLPSNPFAQKSFADFQIKSGKATHVHTLKNKEGQEFFVYEYPLFRNYTIFYTYDYSKQLHKLAKKNKAIYTIIEPEHELKFPSSEKPKSPLKNFIPRHTLIIDLNQSTEEILNNMHPKGRYNIRLAQKRGIEIKQSNSIEEFYEILETTGQRDQFNINSKKYYETMLASLAPANAKLFMAYYKGEPIAGILNTYFSDTATYYYGASSNKFRNLMAPYLLQFHAIEDAKQNGYKIYDFLGIANPTNKKDPLQGVTYFKQKFGGQPIQFPSGSTIVHQKGLYLLLKLKSLLR